MESQANQIKAFILKYLSQHARDIVQVTAAHFDVSRTTVHRHLTRLIKENKIIKTGTTRQVCYTLTSQHEKKLSFKLDEKLSEGEIWESDFSPLVKDLQSNIIDILGYGFTEIFNNTIDHSQGARVEVQLIRERDNITILIQDDGIGVFERIMRTFAFEDYKECLLHLTKGKLTTDPIRHTGEGLFFSSRVFDEFFLEANQFVFYRNNLINDWLLERGNIVKGTKVTMKISASSKRKNIDVFNQYTDFEDFSFIKTDLLVDLSQLEGERLLSRSQAKRLLARLEPFIAITLDFLKVKSVGQGFVDEIFRVYPLQHPDILINYINANEEVAFMIKRGLPK